MTLIKAKDIIGSKAVTSSGQLLGRVVDFDIEINNQNIANYYVQGELLGLFKEPLIISSRQVIEIKKDKIIVQDGVIKEKSLAKKLSADIEYVK